MLSADNAEYAQTAIFSLLLPSAAISYMYYRGNAGNLLETIGLSRKQLSWYHIGLGILIFLMLLLLEAGVTVIVQVTNIQISSNVGAIFGSAPLWLLIFSFTLGPLNEEIFFRAFLVPRIGIILSALIFALLHASYDSTFGIEIIAALIFGLLSGWIYKKTGSLYPSLLAHVLVNALTIAALL